MWCLPGGFMPTPLSLPGMDLHPGLAGPPVMHVPGHWQLHTNIGLAAGPR